jgi:hypothetical protein
MAEQKRKRFSNVRYWRYVFTPLLFIILFFGIFMLYTGDKASFSGLTSAVRKNINSSSMTSTLTELKKLSS